MSDTALPDSDRDCEHGALRRMCRICDLQTENDRLRWGIEDALRMLEHAHDGSIVLPLREHLKKLQEG